MKIVSKCNDSRCGTCNHLHTGPKIILKNGGKIFANANMTCKSRNLIYCIKCLNCSEIYIGQTGNALCERIRIYKQQIRQPHLRQIPLSKHSNVCENQSLIVFPFYKVTDTDNI